ncbi:MAG: Hpt domain-containing protein [Alphaproteobacteria bacterium]|nr:Hpt domain-containing protein [Alphaproteobacteria bacterium]
MGKHIEFWQKVLDTHGTAHRSVLWSFPVPDQMSDAEAVAAAIFDFCIWAGISRWSDFACGFEMLYGRDIPGPPHCMNPFAAGVSRPLPLGYHEMRPDSRVGNPVRGSWSRIRNVPKGINTKVGLSRVRGNSELYLSLLESFREKNGDTAADLNQAIELIQMDQVRQLAHSVKGVAANLGADTLASMAADLERAAREAVKNGSEADMTEIRRAFERFKSGHASVLANLDAFFANNRKAPEAVVPLPPANPVQTRKTLNRTALLLDQDLAAAINCLDIVDTDLKHSFLAPIYHRLRQEVADFDSDRARQTIEDILAALPAVPVEA